MNVDPSTIRVTRPHVLVSLCLTQLFVFSLLFSCCCLSFFLFTTGMMFTKASKTSYCISHISCFVCCLYLSHFLMFLFVCQSHYCPHMLLKGLIFSPDLQYCVTCHLLLLTSCSSSLDVLTDKVQRSHT